MTERSLYSISELARELGLAISTTRYYRDAFADRIPSVGEGRRRLYPPLALEILRFINQSYEAGLDRDQIEQELMGREAKEPVAITRVQVHQAPTPPESEYRELVSSILEGERDRRELLWQMVRELSRFGQAVERQHFVLSELVGQIVQRTDHQLPPGHENQEQDEDTDDGVYMPREQFDELRRALASEQELVERLRRSKLEVERRAAAAEEEIEAQQSKQRGMWERLFGQDSEP
jgi:DNA-binding transcriptional MerR regulator